jgi:hypothetical protein
MSEDPDSLPSREEIHRETSTATLFEWHEDTLDLFDILKAQLAAYNMITDHEDEEYAWAMRAKTKAGYAGVTIRRIERRMIQLNIPLPLTVDREERDRIRHLQGVVRFLRKLCDSRGIDHAGAPTTRKVHEA